MEVGHQHGSGVEVFVLVHRIVVSLDALERRRTLDGRGF
jgi:hypothetical protein